MSDLDQRIASLWPEKHEMILRWLNRQSSASTATTQIARRSSPTHPVPLSFAQESLWLVHQIAPQSTAYNIPRPLRLKGALNVAALEQSLQELVNRHETLRSTFPAVNGHPSQMIAPTLPSKLFIEDFAYLPEVKREQRARERINEETARPFDLTKGPLLRINLLRLAENEHILLLLVHHIISDGWSTDITLKELTTLYSSFSASQPSPLPELPIQYADYAIWQRERLKGEQMQRLLAYWKQQLAGAPAVLDLPTDHPRPSVQSFKGAELHFEMSPSLAEQLRLLSHQEQTSHFMTLLAAFQALLSRYTGREDIVVGSPIANRNRSETEGLIGFLVNMLVLRANLANNLSFRSLLRQVRKTALEGYTHQELPFEKLVEALQPERSLSYSPIFQVLFALENATPSTLEAGGLIWQTLMVDRFTAQFDLQLIIHEDSEKLSGFFAYNTDLFEKHTIERMVGHWLALLEEMVTHPDQPIAILSLLTEGEREQLLVEWNATQADYPQDQCLHQLIEQQAAQTPEALAVVYGAAHLAYRELDQRANHLAHALRARGVGPNVLVGLCVERSLDMIVGLLGILKAGGAYVPLDPTYPRDRLAFMLQDSQAPVLVTQQHLLARLPQHPAHTLCLDADWSAIAQEPSTPPASGVQPSDLLYVIYTSGSTGQPKGVLLPHRAIVNHHSFYIRYFGLHLTDRMLQFASLSFDTAAEEIYPYLMTGGTVVLRPAGLAPTPAELLRLIREQQITCLDLPTAYWHTLVQELAQTQAPFPESVRLVTLGGEAVLPQYLQLWQHHVAPRVRLENGYGPTETAITATFWQVPDPGQAPGDLTSVPIGRPLANTRLYVLDRALQPVPLGIPGELYIGGAGVARGYLNRPELTAERFIPDPFNAEPGARLYKTGDLVRWRADGNLEFIGRLDQQVKIRGFRIELGEIEAALSQHPAVRQAVVVVREDVPGDKRLVAYVLPSQQPGPTSRELHRFLKGRLPDYMLPSAFVCLEAFPQTPNGKLDRLALPMPELTRRAEEETFKAPTLKVHEQLISIWEELLMVRPIGIRDNFFELGGHSLLTARLIYRIEQVFGKKLSFVTLFAEPTVEHLANALLEEEGTSPQVLLEKNESDPRAPVVAVQVGGSRRPFFFLHGQDESHAYYCFPLARALGADQPFYALERYRLDGLAAPPTFDAMAIAHLKSMRAIQPEGPYLLGGWCNGGLLAYEIARQLHAEGQVVDLLVLMDPTPPVPATRYRVLRGLVTRCGRLVGPGQDKQLDWFLRLRRVYLHGYLLLRHGYTYLRNAHPWKLKDSVRLPYFDGKKSTKSHLQTPEQCEPEYSFLEVDFGDYLGTYGWVIQDYKPSGWYPGKIAFFWTSKASRRTWRHVEEANEVEVHLLPGDHMDTLTNHLDILADKLSICLSKAQGLHAVEEYEQHPITLERIAAQP